jgi:predicted ATPase
LKPVDGLFISKAHQKLTIAAVKAHPTHSFFMHGDAEKGKTHLMTALFRAALENEIVQQGVLKNRGTCVFRVFTEQLLSELKEWFAPRKDNEPAPPVPTVTVKKFQVAIEAGFRISLFLDEYDKMKASEFEMNKLGHLIDMVYASKGQLVATSNKAPATLVEKWDSDMAKTSIRRIGRDEMHNTAHMLDFDHPQPVVTRTAAPKPEAPEVEVEAEEAAAAPPVPAMPETEPAMVKQTSRPASSQASAGAQKKGRIPLPGLAGRGKSKAASGSSTSGS